MHDSLPRCSPDASSALSATVTSAIVAGACSADQTTDASKAADATDTTIASDTTAATTAPPAATSAPATTAEPAPEATVAQPTTTPISTADAAAAFSEAGPHAVGVTTSMLPTGNLVEVWYPAVAGTTGEVTYDVRDFTPPAIRDILTADIPASYSFDGTRDADAADGAFPVVLFSHGFTGIRLQSTFLTAHLASWGMVVAAPDHPSRDLFNVLSGTASGDPQSSVDDLLGALDLVTAANDETGGRLGGRVDAAKVVAVGHSAGGGTILGASHDPRVAGYVSLASGVSLTSGATSGDTTSTTVAPAPLPDVPSFFIAGALDGVISAEERTRPSFEAVPAPSRLWIIDGVGHNGFDDFCTFGNGAGIIGVARASGLGGLLDAQPQLRALGEDGCLPPAVPVAETFPIIRHAVTSWIRNVVGIDIEPVGLDGAVAGAYSVAVEIVERL